MMAEESTRTRIIRESKVDDDMPMAKKAVRAVTLGASQLADKLGFTQEKEYSDKSTEELVKKRKGGKVRYDDGGEVEEETARSSRLPNPKPMKPKGKTVYIKKGGSIDGCAIRGKTRAKLK